MFFWIAMFDDFSRIQSRSGALGTSTSWATRASFFWVSEVGLVVKKWILGDAEGMKVQVYQVRGVRARRIFGPLVWRWTVGQFLCNSFEMGLVEDFEIKSEHDMTYKARYSGRHSKDGLFNQRGRFLYQQREKSSEENNPGSEGDPQIVTEKLWNWNPSILVPCQHSDDQGLCTLKLSQTLWWTSW